MCLIWTKSKVAFLGKNIGKFREELKKTWAKDVKYPNEKMESYTADGGIASKKFRCSQNMGGWIFKIIHTLTLTENSTMNAYNINNLLKITWRCPHRYQIDFLTRLLLGSCSCHFKFKRRKGSWVRQDVLWSHQELWNNNRTREIISVVFFKKGSEPRQPRKVLIHPIPITHS